MKNFVKLIHQKSKLSELRFLRSSWIKNKTIPFLGLLFLFLSCGSSNDNQATTDIEKAKLAFEAIMEDQNNMIIHFPDEDPGIPIYARVGPILDQFFVSEGQLVIPFYRDPECVPDTFNLLNYYDPPSAFGCELTVVGKFVIEKTAEAEQFPIMVHSEGSGVHFWIVDWNDFQSLMASGNVTIRDIDALDPVKAKAHYFEEYLSPRINEHQVIIEAKGSILDSDQEFNFSLTHEGNQIKQIQLEIL